MGRVLRAGPYAVQVEWPSAQGRLRAVLSSVAAMVAAVAGLVPLAGQWAPMSTRAVPASAPGWAISMGAQ